MKFSRAGLAAATFVLSLGAASMSQAVTYDAVADFSGSQSGVWSYGFGNASSFTPYDVYGACVTGATCWQSSQWSYSLVPAVIGGNTGTITYFTVEQQDDVLNVHPGANSPNRSGGDDLDSIVRFTAPTAGSYAFSGFFRVLDVQESNGVNVFAGPSFSSFLQGFGAQVGFSGVANLAAGQTLDFRVNRAGDYYYDSTGLNLTVASVPEPGAWALMIAGFGGVGGVLRSRRRRAFA